MTDPLSIFYITSSILFALATLLLGLRSWLARLSAFQELLAVLTVIALCGVALAYAQSPPGYFIFPAVLCIAMLAVPRVFRAYSPIGILFYMSNIVLSIAAALWGVSFIAAVDVSFLTRMLLFIAFPMLFVALPLSVLQMIEQYDVLCRTRWLRPREPRRGERDGPMVSLHVPVFAEPPELVIATLNAIARLKYHSFEVLVVDNNTKEEALWKPVEEHCRQLGPRFRFFHIDPLEGAKAGALNFALARTAPEAQVVGIIDSDYHPDQAFIRDLIGYFEDPQMGFVQTPHDYRQWQGSTYLTMCYWEYKAFQHTVLVALNERNATLTIGTMCLLRKSVLQQVGGWATWCLTEDSELAIRIHDAGYSSVYVPRSYGQGLIPDTFGDYVKQRYRWIAGPVQEFKHHFLRLVGVGTSKLSLVQRIHHLHHGFEHVLFGLNLPLLAVSVALVLSMAVQREVVQVPLALWLSLTLLLVSNLFLYALVYRVVLRATLREMLMAGLANKALSFAMNRAAWSALMRSRQSWKRTNKFARPQTLGQALQSTGPETILGVALIVFAAVVYALMPYQGLLTMCLIGIVYRSLDHLAAPVTAYLAVRSQRLETQAFARSADEVRNRLTVGIAQ